MPIASLCPLRPPLSREKEAGEHQHTLHVKSDGASSWGTSLPKSYSFCDSEMHTLFPFRNWESYTTNVFIQFLLVDRYAPAWHSHLLPGRSVHFCYEMWLPTPTRPSSSVVSAIRSSRPSFPDPVPTLHSTRCF